MLCNRCGGQVPENAAFCPFCGEILNIRNAVTPVMNNIPPVYYPPVKKKKTWLIVVAVVAYVLVINLITSIGSNYLISSVFSSFSGDYTDELRSPESVAEAYFENFFSEECNFSNFNFCTSVDWNEVFADICCTENNLPETDYDLGYEYAQTVFDEFCEHYVPAVAELNNVTIDSVTVQPFTVIHKYINIFDDYFRPHGLSSTDYVSYSNIKNIHEVSLTLTFSNKSGETLAIPVIVNVAEYDGYYDVISDSLFSDRFMVFALTEYSQDGV